MKSFEYRHIVGFEETNLVGNVYFANHLKWQGRCRELFLRRHLPEVVDQMAEGLAIITVRCGCDYLAELSAFDEVAIRMRLGAAVQNRVTMLFEYWRVSGGTEELVARGEQQVAFMMRSGAGLTPVPIPERLKEAFETYANG